MPPTQPAKPFPFRIRFSGLCAFVFEDLLKVKPLNGQAPPPLTEATVLLKNLIPSRLLTPREDIDNERTQILDPHYPQLVFRLADLDESSPRRPDLVSSLTTGDDGKKVPKGLCLLHGRELEIRPEGQPPAAGSLVVPRDEPRVKDDPQGADAETLWWVATVEDAFPGRGRLRAGLLDEEPNLGGEIVTRLRLTQGRLFSSALSDLSCTFEFPGSEEFDQRIATEISLEIPDVQEKVELAFRNGGAPEESLVFRSADGSPVEIEIRNAEIDDFLGLAAFYTGASRPEADFEVYFEMSAGFDPNLSLPVPRPRTEDGGFSTLGDTRHDGLCPPSVLSAS